MSRYMSRPDGRVSGSGEDNSTVINSSSTSYTYKGGSKKRQRPIAINLLTRRNKDKQICEICEKYATLQCAACKATYYCTTRHMEIDEELHKDICTTIKVIRAPDALYTSQAIRERMKAYYFLRVDELYRYTLIRGRTVMINGDFDLAIASTRTSLKTVSLAYGETLQTILPLTVLGESYLKKRRLHRAQRCLVACMQQEAASVDISDELRAAIRYLEGLVSMATKDYTNAKLCFAEQIYLYSESRHPEHISTASGYLKLACIFMKMQKQLLARSLIRRTVDIWSAFVTTALEKQIEDSAGGLLLFGLEEFTKIDLISDSTHNATTSANFFQKLQDICDRTEAASSLQYCNALLRQLEPAVVKPADYIEIDYALAGMEFINNNHVEARYRYIETANKCVVFGLRDQPIYHSLVRYKKECDTRIKVAKARGAYPNRASSRSESLVSD